MKHSLLEGGPPRGFREQGKKSIYFRGTREQRSNFEGNRGTKTILGNREHKKTTFRFLGNRGTSQFISGELGNRYPPPLGGPLECERIMAQINWVAPAWEGISSMKFPLFNHRRIIIVTYISDLFPPVNKRLIFFPESPFKQHH